MNPLNVLQPMSELLYGNDMCGFTPLARTQPMQDNATCMHIQHVVRAWVSGDYRGLVGNGTITLEAGSRLARRSGLIAHTALYDYITTGDVDYLNLPIVAYEAPMPTWLSYFVGKGYLLQRRRDGANRYLFIGYKPSYTLDVPESLNDYRDLKVERVYL